MKKLRRYASLVLIFCLLCSYAAAAEKQEYDYINNWIVAKYEVSQNAICAGDTVDITVWLYNANHKTEEELQALKVAPETSSFNSVAKTEKQTDDYEDYADGCLPVVFEGAVYTGQGNTFMMRVDGEVVPLTIYECLPDSELPQFQDQTTPFLQVGRYDQPAPITKGARQTVTLWVNNISDFQLEDVVVTVTPSSDLQITDNSITYPIGRIWRDDVAFFDVGLFAYGEISTAAQSLTLDIAYTYYKDEVLTRGSASHTVPLQATASKASDAATASVPNVIVSGYDYGADKIFAGSTFDLGLTFRNTSTSQTVENMVMTIDPGTALAITSSSNSVHFPSLAPGAEQTYSLNLQALPDAPSAPAAIQVLFRYEYFDGSARQSATAEQTVSLPIYQADRFEITQNSTYVESWQYQESFLTLSYINKGKGTVYNVSATVSDEIPAVERVQHVGNVQPGEDGTIDFIITPETAGDASCTVTVTYEDSSMAVYTKEFTFDLTVNEMFIPEPMPEEMPMEEAPEGGSLWYVWVIAAAVLAGVTLLIVRRKKQKKSEQVDSFVFDDTEEDLHVPS